MAEMVAGKRDGGTTMVYTVLTYHCSWRHARVHDIQEFTIEKFWIDNLVADNQASKSNKKPTWLGVMLRRALVHP